MSLGSDDVRRIARLARLAVPAEAEARHAHELSAILTLVRQLESAVTAHVAPLAHPLDASAPLRADVATEADRREALMGLAPDAQGGLYRVPRVIE